MTSDVAIFSAQDDVRLLLRGLLRLHRYRVVGEGNAPVALAQLPKDSQAVVVVDADLDEVGWSEAVTALHRARPTQRVVLLSATRSPRIESQAKALGISAVVRRPFAVHQLVEAVNGPDGHGPETAPSAKPAEPAPGRSPPAA
ncbi:MAG TPA: response regulator [Thermoplasmata archaeon]|nr:response regulator [Thermoplasmata archaeon]